MANGYCLGQPRHRTFSSPEKVLLDSAALENSRPKKKKEREAEYRIPGLPSFRTSGVTWKGTEAQLRWKNPSAYAVGPPVIITICVPTPQDARAAPL